jgi:hypothetical protein
MRKLGAMDYCNNIIERARANDETVDYYLAAKCGFDHPGLDVDGSELINWFSVDANIGEFGSLKYLGEMYEKSIGVNGNINTALSYYDKAIKHYKVRDDQVFKRLHEEFLNKIENLRLQNSCEIRSTKIFDTYLKCSDINMLDNAIRASGATQKKRMKTSIVYDSRDILEKTKELEVYFTNAGDFACMKYSYGVFLGNSFIKDTIDMLIQKYGFYEEYSGKVIVRGTTTWKLDDGVEIVLKKDMNNSTLEYCLPANEAIRVAELEKIDQKALTKKAKMQSKAY